MRNAFTCIIGLVFLDACSPASAVTIDPANDIHCSVVSFYFHGLAKHEHAPEIQIRATKGLQDWYAAKMKVATAGRFADLATAKAETEPLLDAINSDPASMRDELLKCAERATADPAFNGFADSYMQP